MIQISKQQKDEFKATKNIFDTATRYFEAENNKLGQYYEDKAVFNCEIFAQKLNLNYNIIINLIFDFNYTLEFLNNN